MNSDIPRLFRKHALSLTSIASRLAPTENYRVAMEFIRTRIETQIMSLTGLSLGKLDPVSYTHLTLPTILRV